MDRKSLMLKRADLIRAAKDAAVTDEKFTEIKAEIEGVDRALERISFLETAEAAAAAPALDPERAAHDEAKRAGKPGTFKSLGDFAIATVNATRGQVDPRLFRASLGNNESAAADGGFLVQTDLAAMMSARMYETGSILSRCRRYQISSGANALQIPALDETSRANGSRSGGVAGYWVGEGNSATATKPTFRQLDLKLRKLVAMVYVTDELLADASALNQILTEAVSNEMVFKVEDAIVNGTGAGQPLGILNSGAVVEVAKETGQTAATFVSANALKADARTYRRSDAVWLVNQDVLPQLPQMTVGGTSVGAYLPPGGLSGAQFATLLGRPVLPVEYCATLGTAGDVISANLGEYVVIEKGGIESASSMHVQFLTGEMAFRFTYRIEGQPAWNAALTPFKGSNSISPFVTVATRA